MNEISINSNKLQIREYNGQRVVTFKDIDAVHGRKNGTAHRNFKANRNRFIEGVDYFRRNSSEAKKEYNIAAPNGLTLITESGYLMLAKSFTDDLAWTVQRELVNNYFRVKSPEPPTAPAVETTEYRFFTKTYHGIPVITLADFSHFTGTNADAVRFVTRRACILNAEWYILEGRELTKFKLENPGVCRHISSLVVLTMMAVKKLLCYYGSTVEIPMIEGKKPPVTLPAPPIECVLKREPSKEMKRLMERLHNENKAIEGISYMLLCPDTKDNHENQREQLVKRIRALRDCLIDVSAIVIE